MSKKTFILTEDLHIQDPHDVFLSLFESSNDEIILDGTMSEFLKRAGLLMLGFFGMRVLLQNQLPSIIGVVLAVLCILVSVLFVSFFVEKMIPLLLTFRPSLILQASIVFGVMGIAIVYLF